MLLLMCVVMMLIKTMWLLPGSSQQWRAAVPSLATSLTGESYAISNETIELTSVFILEIFLYRLEVGTHHWTQCNDTPVKYARFPVTGLIEGRSYTFRVRALNHSGVSRPSRASDTVVAMDPSDRARLRGEGYLNKD